MTGPREAHWLDQLQEDGYCIIPQLVAEQQIAAHVDAAAPSRSTRSQRI